MLDAHSKAVYAGKFDEWAKDADILLKFSANGICVSHLGPEDIVSNIIKAVLDGKRPWDMEKVSSIDAYMKTAMRSEVWNAKQKSKKNTSLIELIPNDIMEDYDEDFALKQVNDKVADDFSKHFENKDLLEMCYKALDENEDHQLIFLAMKDFGFSDNKGIAEYYGMQVDKVVYIKRELLKKLYSIVSKYKNN